MAAIKWDRDPFRDRNSQRSRRSVLLNLLARSLDVLAGTMSRTTSHRAEDQRHRGKQQQNYSFNHNLPFVVFCSNDKFSLYRSGQTVALATSRDYGA
jgi:hypothetical protein